MIKSIYKNYIKRGADIVLSSMGIALLSVPMALVGIAVRLDSDGPVLFRQKRIGQDKKEFMLIKFRSMPISVPDNVATHQLDVRNVRLSPFQSAIRKYSVDELPQLYNILKGEMSLIGPRPALWNQFDLIEKRDEYGINGVKPGLTGWAQINGRDELSIDQKVMLDKEYTDALNSDNLKGVIMDLKCLFLTAASVVRHDGVVEGGTGVTSYKAETLKSGVIHRE